MAQAQAFAAMQNAWTTPFGQQGPPPPGFNPQAAAFQPGVGPGPRGGPPPPMMGGRPGPPMGRPSGPPGPPAPPAAPTFVLPTRPTDESICKHGVKCTKPQCPYSHPSPVATEESGLVLSSEACEKQLECEDKVRKAEVLALIWLAEARSVIVQDCPKSHVSPSQKTAKTTSNAKGETTFVPPPKAAPAPPVADPTSIPGAGERPCKFGGACTRPGCVFLHPWDVRGDSAQAGSKVPCRWGASCTRREYLSVSFSSMVQALNASLSCAQPTATLVTLPTGRRHTRNRLASPQALHCTTRPSTLRRSTSRARRNPNSQSATGPRRTRRTCLSG